MPVLTALESWVDDAARRTRPDRVVWCDGSDREYEELVAQMLRDGSFISINEKAYPNSYLHRSNPNDVARTEGLTYICTTRREDAGPNNNWMDPAEAKERVGKLFDGCMQGRTMYVIPYLMGVPGSPHARVGIEVTDSPYVVANMRIMTRMGAVAMDALRENGGEFVPGLHSIGDLDPKRRFILHFPEEQLIWSIGSGYGGNALLGKKSSRSGWQAGWAGRTAGWPNTCSFLACKTPTVTSPTWAALSQAPAARPIWRCSSRRLPTRAGKSGPSATISRGCASARMAASGPSTLRTASLVSHLAPMSRPTPTRWPRSRATRSSPTSRGRRTVCPGGRALTRSRRRRPLARLTGSAERSSRARGMPPIRIRASPRPP